MKRKLGWIRDSLDHRDLEAPRRFAAKALPRTAELASKMPPVYDQRNLGSCTANAGGAAHQFTKMEQGQVGSMPSRLQLYWCTRYLMGTTNQDSGASIRDTFKAMAQYGVAKESLWPYKVSEFKKKPSKAALADAAKKQAIKYMRVAQNAEAICDAIAAGDPVVFGFNVYKGFTPNKTTFVVPMPKAGDKAEGGHAVVIVGYDLDRQLFLIRNSWGKTYGKNGHCYMPFDYVLSQKLASDFWIVQAVE